MKHYLPDLLSRIKSNITRPGRIKDYFSLLGSNLSLRPVQLVKEYMVARFLGPADYGLLKSVELINMMNKFGSLGYKGVAAREAGDALGRKDTKRAEELKGNSFTGELILSTILFLFGLLSSVFFEDYRVSILIILASFSFFASKVSGLFNTEAVIRKDYTALAKIGFFSGLTGSLIVIALVPILEIYIVIATQFFVGLSTVVYFFYFLDYRIHFHYKLNELIRLTKIGAPLAINTLAIGSFKYSERLLILSLLGKVQLGFYGFALAMTQQLTILYKLAMKVRTQDLYEFLGENDFRKTNRLVKRETLYLLASSLVFFPVYYFGVDWLVPLFLPEWSEAVYYAQLSYILIPVEILNMYPTIVLQSNKANQQKLLPVLRILSTLVLAGGIYGIHIYGKLNLEWFIIIIFTAQVLYSGAIIWSYIQYFQRKFI